MLQSVGVGAAGCAGKGVGYAGTSPDECDRGGIPHSIAVQFDTHHHARTVFDRHCAEYDGTNGDCLPGAESVTSRLSWDREHAVSVFLNGNNSNGAQLVTHLLRGRPIPPHRFDDGEDHYVRLVYLPGSHDYEGHLEVSRVQLPCNHPVTTLQPPCHHHATTLQPPCNHHATTRATWR